MVWVQGLNQRVLSIFTGEEAAVGRLEKSESSTGPSSTHLLMRKSQTGWPAISVKVNCKRRGRLSLAPIHRSKLMPSCAK